MGKGGRMNAWLLEGPGEPDAFQLVEREIPEPQDGWVVVRIESFGRQ